MTLEKTSTGWVFTPKMDTFVFVTNYLEQGLSFEKIVEEKLVYFDENPIRIPTSAELKAWYESRPEYKATSKKRPRAGKTARSLVK
jgi:hypothetical protein